MSHLCFGLSSYFGHLRGFSLLGPYLFLRLSSFLDHPHFWDSLYIWYHIHIWGNLDSWGYLDFYCHAKSTQGVDQLCFSQQGHPTRYLKGRGVGVDIKGGHTLFGGMLLWIYSRSRPTLLVAASTPDLKQLRKLVTLHTPSPLSNIDLMCVLCLKSAD